MKFFHSSDADFESKFLQLVKRSDNDMSAVMPVVAGIIDEIRKDYPDDYMEEYLLALAVKELTKLRYIEKRARDYALVTGNGVLNKESVNGILKLLGVDENGLDELDRNILKSIITVYNGGPVGIETLSLLLGEDRRTIEEVYEPYLVKIGFIKRTQRGRIVTEHGYRHLGLEKSLSGKEDVENDYENKLF